MRSDRIAHLDPCVQACDWLDNQTGTDQEIWNRCEEGEWMLWLLGEYCTDEMKLFECCREITALKPNPYSKNLPDNQKELRDLYLKTADQFYLGLVLVSLIPSTYRQTAFYAVRYTKIPGIQRRSAEIIRTYYPEPPCVQNVSHT